MPPAEAGWPLIAENEIDFVFDEGVTAKMAEDIEAPADAVVRFGDNVRAAVRAYFAERARTNWKAIEKQIGDLNRLVDEAYRSVAGPIPRRFILGEIKPVKGDVRGSEVAAERLADRVGSIDQATRSWLERCAHGPLPFPSSDEIRDRRTRKQAIKQWRNILSYGQEQVTGRKRPSGKRSRTIRPLLRVPKSSRSRPVDLAARELVQHLALAYLEATGRSPPRRVNLRIKGPFFRLVEWCFRLIGIPTGNIVHLINEREVRRKEIEARHRWLWLPGLPTQV
jgi:hypothetical protein